MLIDEAKDLVEPWFTKSENEILDEFLQLNGAVAFGQEDYRSVFVPGNRNDRVLIVAHADTVFIDSPHIKIAYSDGLFYSGDRFRGLSEKKQTPVIGGFGIGADDRAGVAIAWYLRNLGHSILITNNEENGCLSAMQLMSSENNAAIINAHQFAVQFDRNGRNDLVFYNVGTPGFQEYCERETNYKTATGTYTDIAVLCERICGVNMSVGYKNEHTCNEVLNLRWWKRTVETAESWLSRNNIPRFTH